MPNRFRHDILLAALFILDGAAHLVVTSFAWIIVTGMLWVGYYHPFVVVAGPVLVGVMSLEVLPLIAAYGLLRGRRWAGRAVVVTCMATAAAGSAVVYALLQSAVPRLSMKRLTFIILYGAVSAGLCLYGAWVAKKRGPV